MSQQTSYQPIPRRRFLQTSAAAAATLTFGVSWAILRGQGIDREAECGW